MSGGYLTRYNGRMPIVLYIPEGYEAKYKIYEASPELYSAPEIMEKKNKYLFITKIKVSQGKLLFWHKSELR